MKKHIIFTIFLTFCLVDSYGQVILKKKELKERLEQISNELQNKSFETAISLFYSKDEIISEENVSKKSIDKYTYIKSMVNQKLLEFDLNKEKVNEYKRHFDLENYCSAIDLLELHLTKENSFKESQDIQLSLKQKLEKAKKSCNDYEGKILQWKKDFSNEEFELLYEIFDISSSEKKYFYPSDIKDLTELQNLLQPINKTYRKFRDDYIIISKQIIDNSVNNNLTYDIAIHYVEKLESILTNYKNELQKIPGKHPEIISNFIQLKPEIESTLLYCKNFAENNKPINFANINYSACENGYFKEFKEGIMIGGNHRPHFISDGGIILDIFTKEFTSSLLKKSNFNFDKKNLTVEITSFEWEFGAITSIPKKSYFIKYDEQGRLNEEDCLIKWFETQKKIVYRYIGNSVEVWHKNEIFLTKDYNSDGVLIKEVEHEWYGEKFVDKLSSKVKNTTEYDILNSKEIEYERFKLNFIYNSLGLITKVIKTDRETGKKEDMIRCDWSANEVACYFLSSYGLPPRIKKIFTFDNNGKLLSEKFYEHEQGGLLRQVNYTYSGNLLMQVDEKIYKNDVGKLINTLTLKYNYFYE